MIIRFLKARVSKGSLMWLGRKFTSVGGRVTAWEAGDSYLLGIEGVDDLFDDDVRLVITKAVRKGGEHVEPPDFPRNATKVSLDRGHGRGS